MLTPDDRAALIELAPLLRRTAQLDPDALARFRLSPAASTVLVRPPFGVLVSRTVRASVPAMGRRGLIDITVSAAEMLAWLDEMSSAAPAARDVEWRAGRPPDRGWRRVESVPDDVVRALVRQGAAAVKDVVAPGNAPSRSGALRSSAADTLLDSTVLTAVSEDGTRVAVTLRALSALVRMGFLPRGGEIFVDVAGGWVRVVAAYGSVYLERAREQLTIL